MFGEKIRENNLTPKGIKSQPKPLELELPPYWRESSSNPSGISWTHHPEPNCRKRKRESGVASPSAVDKEQARPSWRKGAMLLTVNAVGFSFFLYFHSPVWIDLHWFFFIPIRCPSSRSILHSVYFSICPCLGFFYLMQRGKGRVELSLAVEKLGAGEELLPEMKVKGLRAIVSRWELWVLEMNILAFF